MCLSNPMFGYIKAPVCAIIYIEDEDIPDDEREYCVGESNVCVNSKQNQKQINMIKPTSAHTHNIDYKG